MTERSRSLKATVGEALRALGVVAISLAAVQGVAGLLQQRGPKVDFSARAAAVATATNRSGAESPLRFAVATMVSIEETFSTYRRLVARVSRDVGRREVFVLRSSYTDVRRELEQGKVDLAFVCTGTYIRALAGGRIKLLAQPEFENGLKYRCLLIAPTSSVARTLEDLRGGTMAFTDPESNTGCFVPSTILIRRGSHPTTFFKKVVFTGSHDRSIQAVALGVVDAAAVDSLVWESALRQNPALASRVRVIWESEPYGPPPVVVSRNLPASFEEALRRVFLGLHEDEEGRQMLSEIGIARFVPARDADYQTAVELYDVFSAQAEAQ